MVRQALSLLRCVPLQALARTSCTFANRPRQALTPSCRLRGCRAETVRISEVARRTGASAKAIRLYEARGLLPPVPRLNRYRDYSEQDVAWVQLIRQALGLGIGLAAITRLQRGDGQLDWPAVLALLERQRTAIAAERERLARVEVELQQVGDELRQWLQQGDGPCVLAPAGCPGGV
jgi:DNA-binding transcriptional MerR regulator